MRADEADGLPAIGETGRYLGVRPGVDILVAPDGFVDSYYGGDERRPAARGEPGRPPDFGGTGTDPVFELDTEDLPGVLAYRPDPANPEGLRRTYRGLGRGRCSEASNFSCTAFSEVGRAGPIGPGAPEEGCSHRRVLCVRTVV